jgi:hypothetical protein
MSSEDGKAQESPQEGPVVKPVGLEETELTFTEYGMIQFGQDATVILSFFQSENPFFANAEEYNALKEIRTHCVARMVMTPMQFRRLYEMYGTMISRLEKAEKDLVRPPETKSEGE